MKLIVKTWQTKFWNLSLFWVQDLACQVLNHYIILQIHVPNYWQIKTWYSKSWTFWGTKCHNVFHGLVFRDMNTSENNCQDLTDQVSTSMIFFCSRLGMPSFEMLHFCNSMFPSLDIDCNFQDLAFQVLKPFGVINFSIRPKEELWFSCLGLPRHDHKKMIVKPWQPNFWFVCSRLGLLSFEMLHCFANPCSQLLTN